MRSRGAIVITESLLAAGGIIIGIILLVITFNAIFGGQSRSVEDTALTAVASELKITIERVSASGSDVAKEFSFPGGVDLNVTISQKDVEVAYAEDTGRSAKASFATNLNTDNTYNFYGIGKVCIVNRNKVVTIAEGSCSCDRLKLEPCIA